MSKLSGAVAISTVAFLSGAVSFALSQSTLGLALMSISFVGLVAVFIGVHRSLASLRKSASRFQAEAESHRKSLQELGHTVSAIEESTKKLRKTTVSTDTFAKDTLIRTLKNQFKSTNEQIRTSNEQLGTSISNSLQSKFDESSDRVRSTDDFVRDTLVRTVKNQVKTSDNRTKALIDASTAQTKRRSIAQHAELLNELSTIKNALEIGGSASGRLAPGTPPRVSRKPKDADYSESFKNLEDSITGTSSKSADDKEKPRVVFVSSNGAGLGHLTRLSAVDKALDADSLFYTMSSAYKMIGKKSHEIVYFPSHGDLKMRGADWNPLMKAHFSSVVRGFKPDLIVFDGTYVYQGVVATSKELKIPLVWMQRGCWKEEVDRQSAQRHSANKFAKAVLVPGDYGCEEIVDVGPGLIPDYLPPITLVEQEELLSRETARELLHLPQDKKLFLVQLGAGNINDISNIRSMALNFVRELGPEWEPVLVRNPLSQHDDGEEAYSIQAYPLSLYYNAFDAGAFAAGYNTVQESIELGLPAVFVPNPHTKTDDQERRALAIAEQNLGFVAVDENQLHEAIQELSKQSVRESIREQQTVQKRPDGAETAAAAIGKLLGASAESSEIN